MKQSKRKREAAESTVANTAAAPVVAPSPAAAPALAVVPAQSATYTFAASCTVRDSVALKAGLNELLRAKSETILDVGAIERIDTAVLQLLYAFVRDRKSQGGKVVWAGNSECFSEAVNLLGMATLLGIAPDAGATA